MPTAAVDCRQPPGAPCPVHVRSRDPGGCARRLHAPGVDPARVDSGHGRAHRPCGGRGRRGPFKAMLVEVGPGEAEAKGPGAGTLEVSGVGKDQRAMCSRGSRHAGALSQPGALQPLDGRAHLRGLCAPLGRGPRARPRCVLRVDLRRAQSHLLPASAPARMPDARIIEWVDAPAAEDRAARATRSRVNRPAIRSTPSGGPGHPDATKPRGSSAGVRPPAPRSRPARAGACPAARRWP